jgi:hypothetical protein
MSIATDQKVAEMDRRVQSLELQVRILRQTLDNILIASKPPEKDSKTLTLSGKQGAAQARIA